MTSEKGTIRGEIDVFLADVADCEGTFRVILHTGREVAIDGDYECSLYDDGFYAVNLTGNTPNYFIPYASIAMLELWA